MKSGFTGSPQSIVATVGDPDRLTEWAKHALPGHPFEDQMTRIKAVREKVPVFARGEGSKRKRGEIPDRPLKQGKVWEYLRDAFYQHCPTGHIVRIEDQVGRGTPDVYYRIGSDRTMSGWSGWIEIKTGYQTPTDLQLAWHQAEREAGGRVCVLTIRPSCAIMNWGKGPENLGVVSWSTLGARL